MEFEDKQIIRWQYMGDQGEWKDYQDEDNNLIEMAFRIGQRKAQIADFSFDKQRHNGYEIHFEKEYQKNIKTGTKRKIKKVINKKLNYLCNSDEENDDISYSDTKKEAAQKHNNKNKNDLAKWKTINRSSDDEEYTKEEKQSKKVDVRKKNEFNQKWNQNSTFLENSYDSFNILKNEIDTNNNNTEQKENQNNFSINNKLNYPDSYNHTNFYSYSNQYHQDSGSNKKDVAISDDNTSCCSSSMYVKKEQHDVKEETIRRLMELLNIKDNELQECHRCIVELEERNHILLSTKPDQFTNFE